MTDAGKQPNAVVLDVRRPEAEQQEAESNAMALQGTPWGGGCLSSRCRKHFMVTLNINYMYSPA